MTTPSSTTPWDTIHFGAVQQEVLPDNARALVVQHDAATRRGALPSAAGAFARYWSFRACAPYRARTKGRDERGVGSVKHNAIAGHRFPSWAALEAHLAWWMREIADLRVHGTTGDAPLERFRRDEAACPRSLGGRPPFRQIRELVRRVQSDCCIELDTTRYSVPWRLIGESVQVVVTGGGVSVRHAGREVAAACGDQRPAAAGDRTRALPVHHWRTAAFGNAGPRLPPSRPSCCGASANTSSCSAEASDADRAREAAGPADPAEADGDPRPAEHGAAFLDARSSARSGPMLAADGDGIMFFLAVAGMSVRG